MAGSCPLSSTVWIFCFIDREQKLFIRTEANLRTDLSSLTISLKSPFRMLNFFYETPIPFPESASKTLSHIQSTAKYIFLRAPYNFFYYFGSFLVKWNFLDCPSTQWLKQNPRQNLGFYIWVEHHSHESHIHLQL